MIFPDTKLEESFWERGIKYVVGIDEAGRGPWAGPVVAGAVLITSSNQVVEGVRDSKKMSEKKRLDAFEKIKDISTAYGVGIVESEEIDKVGIQRAVQLAMQKALKGVEDILGERVEYLLIDGGGVLDIPEYDCMKINKGDLNHYSIAAGSVLAKVTRDLLMQEYSLKYPEYGFDTHVGYGTKKHLEALQKFGVCDIHRRSYKPIKKLIDEI